MKKNIENRIRSNVAIIYVIVALLCCLMFFHIYSMKDNIEMQKNEMLSKNVRLNLVNELIASVVETQSAASIYAYKKNRSSLDDYRKKMMVSKLLLDSLDLPEIDSLLGEQLSTIYEINALLSVKNPIIEISEKLGEMDDTHKEDSVVLLTQLKDTIVREVPKKSFFKRLGEVFVPSKDTVLLMTKTKVDTMVTKRADSISVIMVKIDSVTKSAGAHYDRHIEDIEKQVSRLVASDKEISVKIFTILLNLHKQTIDAAMTDIANNEKIIDRNYIFSILSGVVALVIVLMFTLLIVGYANKSKVARVELENANERIRKVMESRHNLLLSVSHDIKAPLSSIMSNLDMMDKENEKIVAMTNSGKHILALLDNLLEYSSLEKGTLDLYKSNFNLRQLCDSIYEMFSQMARNKSLEFVYLPTIDKGIKVCTDALKIKQIVINILSNAVKYTLSGKIVFEVEYHDGKLLIKVTDSGVGMPKDKIDSLFAPFTRYDGSSSMAEGSGLGLYVVKGLTELFKGSISIESKLGIGTVVTVSLPIKEVYMELPKGRKKIVIIDDDPAQLMVAHDMLVKLGHDVVTCHRAEDIVPCDVILSDMRMGALSGADISKIARTTPVLIMSADSRYADISKPLTIDALREIFGSNGDSFSLEKMFDGDDDSVKEILEAFKVSTLDNISKLQKSIEEEDFQTAYSVCHKLLPMFLQLGEERASEYIKRINITKGEAYNGWRTDVQSIIELSSEYLNHSIQV